MIRFINSIHSKDLHVFFVCFFPPWQSSDVMVYWACAHYALYYVLNQIDMQEDDKQPPQIIELCSMALMSSSRLLHTVYASCSITVVTECPWQHTSLLVNDDSTRYLLCTLSLN